MYKWISFVLIFFLFSCSQSALKLSGFEAMLGKWKATNGEMTFFETWKREDSRMIGTGCVLQGKDTTFGEKLVVEFVNKKLVYIADVKKQNPVMFTCTAQTNGSWIFENTDHDFPNKISYNMTAQHKLSVILEGVEKGSPLTEKLNFERIANE